MSPTSSLVTLRGTDVADQAERSPGSEASNKGFESESLVSLWTEIGELVSHAPVGGPS